MDTTWKDYETAVFQLLEGKLFRWFPHLPKRNVILHGKKKYVGSKGEYEIDASAEVMLGDVSLLFIVECKYWDSSVVQDVVLEFESKIRDLGAHKGIIVSKNGFQKGALRLARAHGIALWTYNPGCGRSFQFDPVTCTINVAAYVEWFETVWLKWLRGLPYHPEDWDCNDYLLNWWNRYSQTGTAVRMATMSFLPVWAIALAYGAARDLVNSGAVPQTC